MYAPLEFLEQVSGYFQAPVDSVITEGVNNYAMHLVDETVSKHKNEFYATYKHVHYRTEGFEKLTRLADVFKNDLQSHTGYSMSLMSTDDAYNYMFYADIRNTWRKNKVAYRVDDVLVENFVNMDIPKELETSVVTKYPVDCFYIDYCNAGDLICKYLVGTFVVHTVFNETSTISFLHLLETGKFGYAFVITNMDAVCTDGVQKLPTCGKLPESTPVVLDTGETVLVNEAAFYKFFVNFCLYLNAANREVEISERTKANHSKVVTNIKDKFREVKEFDVGVRYGSQVRAKIKRFKYTGDVSETKSTRTVSAHYRSAHWHHYWVGSGEDKELVLKWVEGVFVHGDNLTDNVVVHKVIN